ncbi:MAG TPA: glycosyltransferase 87 family protein [Chloroflexota bacterium]|nr:glycosyltransferase 87 family protein [Chloroflexota bacterium]
MGRENSVGAARAGAPACVIAPRELLLAISGLALVATVRLAFLGTDWRSPDAIEYFDAARQLAHGAGFTLTLKFHYFTSVPAVHAAWGERPVLYPLFLAAILRLFGTAGAAQAATTLLALLEIGAFWLLARRFVAAPYALGAALLCGLAPRSVALGRFLWSETLYAVLLLLALLICTGRRRGRAWLAGLLLGLAALCRQEGWLVMAGVLALLAWRGDWRSAGAALLTFLAMLAPYLIFNARAHGDPFYSSEAFHLRVRYFADGMWFGFDRHLPSVPAFVQQNAGWLRAQTVQRLRDYLWELLAPGWLGPLGLLVVVPRPAWWREPRLRALAALGLGSLLLYACPLVADPDKARFPLTAFLVGALLAAYDLQEWLRVRRRPYLYGPALLLLGCWLALLVGLDVRDWRSARAAGAGPWGAPALGAAEHWLRTRTPPGSVVAADNPWDIVLDAGRPAIVLPFQQDAATFLALERRYGMRYLVVAIPRLLPEVSPSSAVPRAAALQAAHLRLAFTAVADGSSFRIYARRQGPRPP